MIDIVILDKALTTLSFITPFLLYGGIIMILASNNSPGLSQQCLQPFMIWLKDAIQRNHEPLSHEKSHTLH